MTTRSDSGFRWTSGATPFFSQAQSGLAQKHGLSVWNGRELSPMVQTERYIPGPPWNRNMQGPPAGGWQRGNHWGTFRGPDGNFNDPRLAEFRNGAGLYGQVISYIRLKVGGL